MTCDCSGPLKGSEPSCEGIIMITIHHRCLCYLVWSSSALMTMSEALLQSKRVPRLNDYTGETARWVSSQEQQMEREDERARLLGQRETAHEPHGCRGKGEMFNSLQGRRHKSLYSWEREQEVSCLILNTSLILACKHPFITHECDGETWDTVSVEESFPSRADWSDWSDWSDGRVTACSGLWAEKLFVCWHTLNHFIVAHFHSNSFDPENCFLFDP